MNGGEGDDTLFLSGGGPAGAPTLDGGVGDDRFFVAFGDLPSAASLADSAGSADAISVVCPLRRTVRPTVGPTSITLGAERVDHAGIDSPPKRCSPDGFEGAVASTGPAPPATTRLVGTLVEQRVRVRAGRPAHVDFISTNPGSALLKVRRGSTPIIHVTGVVRRRPQPHHVALACTAPRHVRPGPEAADAVTGAPGRHALRASGRAPTLRCQAGV